VTVRDAAPSDRVTVDAGARLAEWPHGNSFRAVPALLAAFVAMQGRLQSPIGRFMIWRQFLIAQLLEKSVSQITEPVLVQEMPPAKVTH
jgi:hypothetical protein